MISNRQYFVFWVFVVLWWCIFVAYLLVCANAIHRG
jgi:hypothetical protein